MEEIRRERRNWHILRYLLNGSEVALDRWCSPSIVHQVFQALRVGPLEMKTQLARLKLGSGSWYPEGQ